MTPQQINTLINSLPKPPDHDKWVEIYQEMTVHTRGNPPGEILTKRRPNEDPDVLTYRQDIYEPITKGSINRAIDKLYRIFLSANFSIQVSEALGNYLAMAKFKRQSFYNYIQKYVVRRMVEDPNGLLIWVPDGPGLTDPTTKVEVKPVLVESGKIHYMDEESVTWLSDELADVSTGTQVKKEGLIYYTMTNVGFYKHTQVGLKTEKKFELTLIYEHNIGQVPSIVLGGDLTDGDYFTSYFSPFLPFANEAIRQYSDWQGVMTTSCFPYREEQAETCTATGCNGGEVKSKTGDRVKCKKCNGTGRVISRSPYGVFLREKSSGPFDTGSTNSSEPMIRFISPDVAIIRESREAWELLLKKAERALCLDVLDEAQSGVAKELDREDSFMVLTKISNNVFDEIIFKSLKFIEAYREINGTVDPKIIKPISFSMKTESDLIDELNKLSDKNAPVAFMVETTKDLAKKRFSGNKMVSRMIEVLVSFDPLYNLSAKDKQLMVAAGFVQSKHILKSLLAYKGLQEVLSEKGPEFLEQDLPVIFAALDAKLDAMVRQYEPMTMEGPDELGVPNDVLIKEQEARANLKGSVGGVQGIINIQQSVSAGATDREAAIELLMEIYGFDRSKAERIIGNPKPLEV